MGIDETRRGHWSADETDRCGARGLEAKEGEKKMKEKKIVDCQLLGLRRWRAAPALAELVAHEGCKGMDAR